MHASPAPCDRYVPVLWESDRRTAGGDEARTAQLNIYTDCLNEFLKELSTTASDEKRREIEDLFWFIEEYKVSLFAQELKTAVPVSKKRLDAIVKEIKRMI